MAYSGPRRDLKYLRKYNFRMLTHKSLLHSIQKWDWFTSIDLKDAYFHIQIHPQHRRFLRFAAFGLSLAPRIFTTPLRQQGIRILAYLDDWLFFAGDAYKGSVNAFECSGVCSKPEKELIKGVIRCKIHFTCCLNINVCWKCVYTSTL